MSDKRPAEGALYVSPRLRWMLSVDTHARDAEGNVRCSLTATQAANLDVGDEVIGFETGEPETQYDMRVAYFSRGWAGHPFAYLEWLGYVS